MRSARRMYVGTSERADGAPACSISVAWCKKHEVPIEKIYTKVLLEKFGVRLTRVAASLACANPGAVLTVSFVPQWSMETDSSFDF